MRPGESERKLKVKVIDFYPFAFKNRRNAGCGRSRRDRKRNFFFRQSFIGKTYLVGCEAKKTDHSDTGRGSLICTTASEFYIDMRQTPLFGPASLHSMDYGLYYDNLVRNVRTRTEAYLAGRRSGPAAGPSPS